MHRNAIKSTTRPGFESKLCVLLHQQSNLTQPYFLNYIIIGIEVTSGVIVKIKLSEIRQCLAHTMYSIQVNCCYYPPLIQAGRNHLGLVTYKNRGHLKKRHRAVPTTAQFCAFFGGAESRQLLTAELRGVNWAECHLPDTAVLCKCSSELCAFPNKRIRVMETPIFLFKLKMQRQASPWPINPGFQSPDFLEFGEILRDITGG